MKAREYKSDNTNTIIYYKRKTELKGVAGQELFYDLAKALLNSIYGMLWEGIELAGRDFCYCDTDSVKALGAKKYAYVDQAGELHITIAGVGKGEAPGSWRRPAGCRRSGPA